MRNEPTEAFNSIVILNTQEEAKRFTQSHAENLGDWLFVPTHPTLVEWLTRHDLPFVDPMRLVSDPELDAIRRQVYEPNDTMLATLDTILEPLFTRRFGVSSFLAWSAMYRHFSLFLFASARIAETAFERLFATYTPLQVMHYIPRHPYWDGRHFAEGLLESLSKRFQFKLNVIEPEPVETPEPTPETSFDDTRLSLWSRAQSAARRGAWTSRLLSIKCEGSGPREEGPPVILFEPLYDFEFLRYAPLNRRTIYWPHMGIPPDLEDASDTAFVEEVDATISTLTTDMAKGGSGVARLIFKDMRADLHKNLARSLAPLLALERLMQNGGVALGIWGNPPNYGGKGLIMEYLMQNGVPVIGMLHGGGVVEIPRNRLLIDRDIKRCTHYVSYGFTAAQLEKSFPGHGATTQIIPAGSTKMEWYESIHQGRTVIDILYPIMFHHDFYATPYTYRTDTLIDAQKKILDRLNEYAELSIMVKPLPGCTPERFALFEYLAQRPRLDVERHYHTLRCLTQYDVKAVVIDCPATALYEAMAFDVEIFLLTWPDYLFTEEARVLLEKRVHLCETVDSLLVKLDAFRAGTLSPKRNDEYFRAFVSKPGARETIRRLIEDLANSKP